MWPSGAYGDVLRVRWSSKHVLAAKSVPNSLCLYYVGRLWVGPRYVGICFLEERRKQGSTDQCVASYHLTSEVRGFNTRV